jgi:CRISPR system Cascade subunit CasD
MRDTGLEPSKSGVVGMVCAALGRRRAEPIQDLAALRLGVRVDRQGKMESDYHTALNVIKASGQSSKAGEAVLSHRFYLADAEFLVGLEGEDLGLLTEIDNALQSPCWPLFLGRKAFPPSQPVHLPDGLQPAKNLYEALTQYPLREDPFEDDSINSTSIRFILEDPQGEAVRVDQPVAPFSERRFGPRRVTVKIVRKEELCISPC